MAVLVFDTFANWMRLVLNICMYSATNVVVPSCSYKDTTAILFSLKSYMSRCIPEI